MANKDYQVIPGKGLVYKTKRTSNTMLYISAGIFTAIEVSTLPIWFVFLFFVGASSPTGIPMERYDDFINALYLYPVIIIISAIGQWISAVLNQPAGTFFSVMLVVFWVIHIFMSYVNL